VVFFNGGFKRGHVQSDSQQTLLWLREREREREETKTASTSLYVQHLRGNGYGEDAKPL